jgi:hypothetical protein
MGKKLQNNRKPPDASGRALRPLPFRVAYFSYSTNLYRLVSLGLLEKEVGLPFTSIRPIDDQDRSDQIFVYLVHAFPLHLSRLIDLRRYSHDVVIRKSAWRSI